MLIALIIDRRSEYVLSNVSHQAGRRQWRDIVVCIRHHERAGWHVVDDAAEQHRTDRAANVFIRRKLINNNVTIIMIGQTPIDVRHIDM